jgi:hypothetical protein
MKNDIKKSNYRVTTFLSRKGLDFLDELEKDIYFTHGIHIPRAKLIEEIIENLREKDNKTNIEEELINKYTQEKNTK